MSSIDNQVRGIGRYGTEAIGAVIQESIRLGKFGALTVSSHSGLKCAHADCQCGDHTHITDVVWETDPGEGDRRWVRLEVRCEEGRGYFLFIRNHAGHTRFEFKLIDGEVSPFEEGVRW